MHRGESGIFLMLCSTWRPLFSGRSYYRENWEKLHKRESPCVYMSFISFFEKSSLRRKKYGETHSRIEETSEKTILSWLWNVGWSRRKPVCLHYYASERVINSWKNHVQEKLLGIFTKKRINLKEPQTWNTFSPFILYTFIFHIGNGPS